MSAPIVVHGLSPSGGRRVTINGQVVGPAHDDHDLVEFLPRAGIYDAEHLLDDPYWVEWRDNQAHRGTKRLDDQLCPWLTSGGWFRSPPWKVSSSVSCQRFCRRNPHRRDVWQDWLRHRERMARLRRCAVFRAAGE
ncbi:hypothetical protein [Streptomyces yanii]|uniref:Uncharacterized protein n=1 Tax=Streptomyces yanii TaxID=78510 RepID=A0ABV5RJL0_9ACTN